MRRISAVFWEERWKYLRDRLSLLEKHCSCGCCCYCCSFVTRRSSRSLFNKKTRFPETLRSLSLFAGTMLSSMRRSAAISRRWKTPWIAAPTSALSTPMAARRCTSRHKSRTSAWSTICCKVRESGLSRVWPSCFADDDIADQVFPNLFVLRQRLKKVFLCDPLSWIA